MDNFLEIFKDTTNIITTSTNTKTITDAKIELNKCIIGGCVRNCDNYIESVFKNINKIISLFDDYHIVIAYDISQDNSLIELQKQQKIYKNMDIFINTNTLSSIRTERLSFARNSILDFIKIKYNQDNQFKYFIILDCDDVCDSNMDESIIKKYLYRNDWDSLSFNRPQYYDIWALSFDSYIYSCWHFKNSLQVVDIMRAAIINRLDKLNDDELLECYSAFNGLAIYRTNVFIDCYYNWNPPIHLMPKKVLKENIKLFGNYIYNSEDCEHRHFHLQAINKNNAKIMISPLYLFRAERI